jgi:hypothetical protein
MPDFGKMPNEELFKAMPDPGPEHPDVDKWRRAHQAAIQDRILNKAVPVAFLVAVYTKAFLNARKLLGEYLRMTKAMGARADCVPSENIVRYGLSMYKLSFMFPHQFDEEFKGNYSFLKRTVSKKLTTEELLQFNPQLFAENLSTDMQRLLGLQSLYVDMRRVRAKHAQAVTQQSKAFLY